MLDAAQRPLTQRQAAYGSSRARANGAPRIGTGVGAAAPAPPVSGGSIRGRGAAASCSKAESLPPSSPSNPAGRIGNRGQSRVWDEQCVCPCSMHGHCSACDAASAAEAVRPSSPLISGWGCARPSCSARSALAPEPRGRARAVHRGRPPTAPGRTPAKPRIRIIVTHYQSNDHRR